MRLLAGFSLLVIVLLAGCAPSFVEPPLTRAALAGDLRGAEELLRRGANPNQHTRPGWGRALIAAASRPKNEAIIRRLVEGGADPNLPGNEGCLGCCRAVALSVAVGADNINALLGSGASLHPVAPGCAIAPVGETDRIHALLQAGVSPNASNGVPPVFFAAGPSMQMLLAAGADVSALDGNGNSAISYGASWRSAEGLIWLRRAGAPLTTNRYGQNALHMAFLHGFLPQDPAVVSLLLQWGVQANSRDMAGRTPLSYAQEWATFERHGVLHRLGLGFLDFEAVAEKTEWEKRRRVVLSMLQDAGAAL